MQTLTKDPFILQADVRGLTLSTEEAELKFAVSEILEVVGLIDDVLSMELLPVKPEGIGRQAFRVNFDQEDQPVLTATDRDGVIPFKFNEGDVLISLLKMGFNSIVNQRKYGNAAGNVVPGVELSGEPFI